MTWEAVRGHAHVVDQFRRAIGRNRLAHAYAFVGPDGVGKATFARTLARCLVCSTHGDEEVEACGTCNNCRQMLAKSHPDVFIVGCPPGKKSIPIATIVGSDERRGREGLCHDLALRPMSARRRIAVIDDAHLLNVESANALLKTLEEPPRDSLLILVANDFEALLPTIRSRCQPIRFGPLSNSDVVELLVANGAVETEDEAELVAVTSGGSLAVAGQLLDERIRTMRGLIHDAFGAAAFDPRTLAESVVSGVEAVGGDRQAQRRAAGWVVQFVIEFLRRTLEHCVGRNSGSDPVAQRLAERLGAEGDAVECCGRLLECCDEASRMLEGNSPVPLVVENLCDRMSRVLRPAVPSRR